MTGQRRTDALGLVAESALAADLDRGTAADRYQVVLHVDEAVLQSDDAPGQSALEDGPYVSAATSRRVACDAATVKMRHGSGGQLLDVGRKTRSVPPALHRALTARDRRCRFPRAVLRGIATPTTSAIGRRVAPRGRTTSSCSVEGTTAPLTRAASQLTCARTAMPCSIGPTAARYWSPHRRRPGLARHSHQPRRGWRPTTSRSTGARQPRIGTASVSISRMRSTYSGGRHRRRRERALEKPLNVVCRT